MVGAVSRIPIYAVAVAIGLVAFVVIFQILIHRLLTIAPGAARDWRDRVMRRYQKLPELTRLATFAWVFAWFKLRLDPMFHELQDIAKQSREIRVALDLGCGYGVAGCAMLEWYDGLTIYGVDPSPTRVRVASTVFAERGKAFTGSAPDFENPDLPARFDAVFVLDVIHFLPEESLDLTLRRIRARLNDGGLLVVRSSIQPAAGGSLFWKFGTIRRTLTGGRAWHRSVEQIREAIAKAGFEIERTQISGANPELQWFIARIPA